MTLRRSALKSLVQTFFGDPQSWKKAAVPEALRLAATCGAWCVAGRGPYQGQLTAADIPGNNDTGPIVHDEPLLPTDLISYHGQAVAFAAKHFGIPAVIVMPDATAPYHSCRCGYA